jgi:parvulin-like peptidyl-prolyl isomerase
VPAKTELKVMAVVNGEQITRQELGRECLRRYGKDVLELMLNRQLIVDACVEKGFAITEKVVDEEIERIAAKFGLSRDRWLQLLQEERGFTEQQYRDDVVWQMLALRALAADRTEVTPEELKKAFESEFGPKVRALLIAVSSQKKADQVHAEAVANPDNFGELSKKHTEDPAVASALGVIPPIRRHLGDANLENTAFSLQPGQVSPVVQVGNMYYILKCVAKLQQQYISSQELPAQQMRLKDRIKENKLRTVAASYFEELQKNAQVVNVFNDPEKQKQMPGIAATLNGRPISLLQLTEECIKRNGGEVLEGEVNRKLLQQELARKQQTVTEQDIDAEVARAAESFGFMKDDKPDVEAWLKKVTEEDGATVDLYVRDAVWPSAALKKLAGGSVQVTDEDLKKGFESNYGERVEVLAIVMGDHRQAQKVWEMARNNPTNAFFGQLATQYSGEPSSRANAGKVPPIRRFGGSPLIEDAAFKLKPGELSGLIAIEDQFIVLRCLGRTRPVETDINQVKHLLVKDITEKKLRSVMSKEFDRLRETSQIDNFLAGTSQSGKSRAATAATSASSAIRPAFGPQSSGARTVAPASATRPVGPRTR